MPSGRISPLATYCADSTDLTRWSDFFLHFFSTQQATPTTVGTQWSYRSQPRLTVSDIEFERKLEVRRCGTEIWRVRLRNDDEAAIVKLYHRDSIVEEEASRQASLFRDIMHPHLATVVGVFESQEHLGIVMEEIVAREKLGAFGDHFRRTCDVRLFLSYAHQLASAVDCLHQRQIVHGDIKPDNVLIGPDSRVVLIDYDECLAIGDETSRRPWVTICGTLPYISPQQLVGDPADPADDVYSFGVCLFELFTGLVPFRSCDVEKQILESPPPSVAPMMREAGFGGFVCHWDDIIKRTLAKEPEDRPSSARELVAALDVAFSRASGSSS